MGERLARFFIGVWENPATRAPLLAIVRSALTNEAAAEVLRGFVLRRLLGRIAGELDVPDPELPGGAGGRAHGRASRCCGT